MARVRGKLICHTAIIRQITKLAFEGLLDGGIEIYNESQRIVPFDDAELALGGRVSSEQNDNGGSVVISYGNNAVSAEYAVIQHYNLEYNHKPPESALYLQTPFLRNAEAVQRKVADRIRDLL